MEGGIKRGVKVSSHDPLLSCRPLCKRIRVLLQKRKKKVHDLRLINLSHPAHFKGLQNYFEVYLLLMTFFKKGAQDLNCPLHLLSFLQVTSPSQPHKDRISIRKLCSKWICGTMKTGQIYFFFLFKFNLPVLWRLKTLCSSFYLGGFKLEKREQKENLQAALQEEEEKNEGRDFPSHFNRAHFIGSRVLN